MDVLVSQAKMLAASGVKELILVAQETTIYGTDIYGKKCLPELLCKLSDIEGIKWIYDHCPEEYADAAVHDNAARIIGL